jgi:tetratricopeptide (TPR) repeat protein
MKLVVALVLSTATLLAGTHLTHLLAGPEAYGRPRAEPPPAPEPTPAEAPPATTPDAPATPEATTPPSEIRVPTELELRRERARALVKRGQDLAGLRQFDEALAAFRAALQAYPAYPLAQYELGITLVETKDLVGAEANLRQAIAMAPDFARAHQALGEVLRRQKRFDDARLAYLDAVKHGPKDTIAWHGLAATLKAQKNEPEALWALESLLAASENTEAPVAVEARKEAAAMIARGVVAKPIDIGPAEPVVAEPEPEPETPETPPETPVEPTIAANPGPLSRYEGDKAFAERRYLDALNHYMAAWHVLVPPPVAAPLPAPDPATTPGADGTPTPAPALEPAPTPALEPAPALEPTPAPAPTPAPYRSSPPPSAEPSGPSSGGPTGLAAALRDRPAVGMPAPTTPSVGAQPAAPATAPKGDPELAYRIGATYAVMNDNHPAIRWWKLALAIDPSRELIARHLGILMARVGQNTERPPVSAAHLMERVKALLLSGDAASAFILVRNRDDVGAGHMEAESRLRLGDYRHARQIFDELLAADPEDRIARAGLGEALLKLGLTEPAAKAIETWMGDNKARPETFIVLRRGELEARLLAPYEPED